MTKHKDILKTMAVDDLAPCGTRASAATEQYRQYMIYVYILIDIVLYKHQKNLNNVLL